MSSKLRLKPEDYDHLDKVVGRTGDEFYSVVTSKIRGRFVRSIHVFARGPMTTELKEFENTSSKLKIRGSRTDVEGSQTLAYKHLYDALISRAYDVPVGWTIHGEVTYDEKTGAITGGKPLTRDEAKTLVPGIMKRVALVDVMGEHYSEARIDEMEGEEEIKGQAGED